MERVMMERIVEVEVEEVLTSVSETWRSEVASERESMTESMTESATFVVSVETCSKQLNSRATREVPSKLEYVYYDGSITSH